jgi:uncharacterized protein (TIGR03437 family)
MTSGVPGGGITTQKRLSTSLWRLNFLFFLSGMAVCAQSVPPLHPPVQTYIYNFGPPISAAAPVTPSLNLGASYSIEFWMRLNPYAQDAQLNMPVFDKGINSTGDPYTAYHLDLVPGTHQLSYFQSTGNTGSSRGTRTTASITPGQWYHVAIVSNNLQVTLYLNGQQQASFTAAGPTPANSVPLVLGNGFPGSLRQFRVWGRALQAAEIPSFATNLLTGSEAGLICDWPLDDGQGQALRDIGPNKLPLQLKNGYPLQTILFPDWMRTEIADVGPSFQVQRLTVPQTVVQNPGVSAVPIDFDSDGNTDLLVCQAFLPTAQPCAAFRNNGKGNFSDATAQVLGPNPPRIENGARDFCVADFNGDGRPDVFIANTGECPGCTLRGGQSHLLMQTPDGRLVDATADAGLPQQRMVTHNVACGDIDGDGNIDLYLQNQPPDVPQLWLNDGEGRFTRGDSSRLPAIVLSTDPLFTNITARFIDVNRDGRLDLYIGRNHGDNQPHDLLLLNDGHGFFTLAPDNVLPNRYGGRDWGTVTIRVADLNGDGWPDLINAVYGMNYCEGAVQILLNNHDGTFRDATELILQPAWGRHGSLFSDGPVYVDPVFPVDFNGDGFMDLLVQGVNQPSRLFLNTGPAGGARLVEVTELLPDSANHFAVADFNGDGSPDVVAWTDECCNRNLTLETWLSSHKFALSQDLIPAVPKGPLFLRGSVLNTASFSANALAPGEVVTIFGRNLGPDTAAVPSPDAGAFPTQLSGTRVLFNNTAAPLVYASAGQVIALVPFGVVPQTQANVVVEYQGVQSPAVPIFVASSAPGMFTSDSSGGGPAALLNVDAATGAVSLNTPQNPAPPGGILVAYITGAGQTDPPSVDGAVATATGGMALPVEAGLDFLSAAGGMGATDCASNPGCKPVQVLYAGPAPGIVAGVIQVNMRLPDNPSASSTHSLGVSFGGNWSQLYATVSIR